MMEPAICQVDNNELIVFANLHNNVKFTAFNNWFLSSLLYVLRSD